MNWKLTLPMILLAATWAGMLAFGAGSFDAALLLSVYAGNRPLLASIALAFTRLGEWPVVLGVSLLAASWLAYRKHPRAALMLLVSTIAARLLIILQKVELARLRPDEHLRMVEVSSLSFPSAHSANSMLVYPLCALLLAPPRWRRVAVAACVLLALCIGASRPVLGVHWPSDVIGGWSFGLFWLLGSLQVAAMLEQRRTAVPNA